MTLDAAEHLMAEALRAVNDSVAELRRVVDGIEQELADLDYAKASRRQVEELHSRVDSLTLYANLKAGEHGGQG